VLGDASARQVGGRVLVNVFSYAFVVDARSGVVGDGGSIYSSSGLERSVRMGREVGRRYGVRRCRGAKAWTGRRGESAADVPDRRRLADMSGEGTGVGGADI